VGIIDKIETDIKNILSGFFPEDSIKNVLMNLRELSKLNTLENEEDLIPMIPSTFINHWSELSEETKYSILSMSLIRSTENITVEDLVTLGKDVELDKNVTIN
jgi:hypothetical protein